MEGCPSFTRNRTSKTGVQFQKFVVERRQAWTFVRALRASLRRLYTVRGKFTMENSLHILIVLECS